MIKSYPMQGIQGPGDTKLPMNEVSGYTQASRIGEVVINAFVEYNEYGVLPDTLKKAEFESLAYTTKDGTLTMLSGALPTTDQQQVVETKPHFFEWASATVGMLAVARRQRSTLRNNLAAETAAPVIVCASMKSKLDEVDYMFAGAVRSNSVRTMDDGVGPTVDEYFTLSLGGMVTIVNNSSGVIHAGDFLAWTFVSDEPSKVNKGSYKNGPRRIAVRIATYYDENVFGKAITFAKPGQPLDVLLS